MLLGACSERRAVERDPALDLAALGRRHRIDPERLRAGLTELNARGFVAETTAEENGGARREVTASGGEALHRIAVARRERLAEVAAQWEPEEREEIAAALHKLAREIVPDPKPTIRRAHADAGAAD